MNAMRLTVPSYNPAKQCEGCRNVDETKVAAQILSYQLAHMLLKSYGGTWEIKKDELLLQLDGVEAPLLFELNCGTLRHKTLRASIVSRYSVEKGISSLTKEIIHDFALPQKKDGEFVDPLFRLFVKLIEIFHARCGLKIAQVENKEGTLAWELVLADQKLKGWISSEGIAENRFGQSVNIHQWDHLRPEKRAAYVFGFYCFCDNYPSPIYQTP
ncbi:MAG: hypothetical protein GX958_11150 [Desulfitobacterium sp.]|nr:hypothetical protein [Desulfitobacterium sp.]